MELVRCSGYLSKASRYRSAECLISSKEIDRLRGLMLENPMPLNVEETNALPLTTGLPSAKSHLPNRSLADHDVTVRSDNADVKLRI